MPIYEYECSACQHKLETLQKVSEPALTDCPQCGKSTLQKIISQTSFQLKGTGWYATDFRNKSPAETKKTETKSAQSESKDTTTSSSGTESTTAATSTDTKKT